MHQATREIVVRAPPKRVWDTLMAFGNYPDWTPAVRIKGDLEPGGKFDYAILVGRPGRRPRHFSLAGNIEQVEPLACLSWDVGLPSLLRMRFAIHFSRRLDVTKVRQSVEISGLLAAVAGKHLAKAFGAIFDRFGRDLQRHLGGPPPKQLRRGQRSQGA
jgi:uncharacterized protein YndB with AHSA1/START domain